MRDVNRYKVYDDDALLFIRQSIMKNKMELEKRPSMIYYLPDPVNEISIIEDEIETRIPESITKQINEMKTIKLFAGSKISKDRRFIALIRSLVTKGYNLIIQNMQSLTSIRKPADIPMKEFILRPHITADYFKVHPDYFRDYIASRPLRFYAQANPFEQYLMDSKNHLWKVPNDWIEEKR